jgi:hypothetical protein
MSAFDATNESPVRSADFATDFNSNYATHCSAFKRAIKPADIGTHMPAINSAFNAAYAATFDTTVQSAHWATKFVAVKSAVSATVETAY